VLEHADAGDLVVAADLGDVAVIHLAHFDPTSQPARFDLLADMRMLVIRQGDAHRMHAIAFRRMQDQARPSRSRCRELLVGLEIELAADVVELGLLRGVQAHVRGLEIGAGIDPPRIHPQAVKIVGNVVVILDVPAVLGARVAPPFPAVRAGFRRAFAPVAQAVAQREDVASVAYQIKSPST